MKSCSCSTTLAALAAIALLAGVAPIASADLASPVTASAAISGPAGMLFVCTEDGVLHHTTLAGVSGVLYDTSVDVPQASTKASLAAAGRMLYVVVGSSSGRHLYCFGP